MIALAYTNPSPQPRTRLVLVAQRGGWHIHGQHGPALHSMADLMRAGVRGQVQLLRVIEGGRS